jgi:hypothetical protein
LSILSQYRLTNEIDAFSIEGLPDSKIPRGAVIEYAPSPNERHTKFIDVHWEGRLYRVLVADVFQHAEFIGSK